MNRLEQLVKIITIRRSILDSYYMNYKKDNIPDEFWVDYYKESSDYYHEYEKTWCFLIMYAIARVHVPIIDDLGNVYFYTYNQKSRGTDSVCSGADEIYIYTCINNEIEDLMNLLNLFNIVVIEEMKDHLDYPEYENDKLEWIINNTYK